MRAPLRCTLSAALAAIAGAPLGPHASAQIVIHEETAWTGPPFSMGDYDEQAALPTPAPYLGPANAPGACSLPPPFPAGPASPLGATLWHAETDCCAAGGGAPAGWGPTFAAYNRGAPAFDYDTGTTNAGAISSYGIGAVTLGPPATGGPLPPQVVLCFEFVRLVEPASPAFDTASVEVRGAPCGEPPGDGTVSWTGISVLSGGPSLCSAPTLCCVGPAHPALDSVFLSPGPAPTSGGKIRFRFDTRDASQNGACGWSLDNVRLTNEACHPPCQPAAGFQPQIASSGGEPVSPNPGFAITLNGAPPGGIAVLSLGVGAVAPAPLPFPSGCQSCCPTGIFFPAQLVGAAGTAVAPIPIPAGLPACVEPLCVQWILVTLPPFGPFNVFTSSAGRVRLQIG